MLAEMKALTRQRHATFREWFRQPTRVARTVIARTIDQLKASRFTLGALLAIGFGIGLIGPFGTFLTEPIWLRVPYFIASISLGYALWSALEWFVTKYLINTSEVIRLLIVAAPFSMLNAIFLVVAHTALAMWVGTNLLLTWTIFLASNLTLSLFSIIPAILFQRRNHDLKKRSQYSDPSLVIRNLLPLAVRDQSIIAIMAEDHYLRVYTQSGDYLIHFRMKDALTALSDVPGCQIHRSWWIAFQSIVNKNDESTSIELQLENGLKLSVSRRATARFRDLHQQFLQDNGAR